MKNPVRVRDPEHRAIVRGLRRHFSHDEALLRRGERNPRSIERLARAFHQREPRVREIRLAGMPRKLMVLGPLRAVEYEISEGFPLHTWHPRSRPMLATDGRRLFIIGGRFKVTRRGIVDLDERGREIE